MPNPTPSSTPVGWRATSVTPRSASSTARPTCATRRARAGVPRRKRPRRLRQGPHPRLGLPRPARGALRRLEPVRLHDARPRRLGRPVRGEGHRGRDARRPVLARERAVGDARVVDAAGGRLRRRRGPGRRRCGTAKACSGGGEPRPMRGRPRRRSAGRRAPQKAVREVGRGWRPGRKRPPSGRRAEDERNELDERSRRGLGCGHAGRRRSTKPARAARLLSPERPFLRIRPGRGRPSSRWSRAFFVEFVSFVRRVRRDRARPLGPDAFRRSFCGDAGGARPWPHRCCRSVMPRADCHPAAS